ncbi:MAG TPA: GNAT family N-acetyltransferase [Candidatus Saccharimonadales bacterium]|nr:GNAT family N-acetyltransferase [Candidatus Saccharimonadales bacterium]
MNVPDSIVVSDKLLLRQLQKNEAEVLFALTDANREHIGTWLPWVETTLAPSDSQAFIEKMLASRQDGTEYGYGIYVDGQLAGHIVLRPKTDDEADIGYWIAASVSGHGHTTAAVEALCKLGFEALKVPKIIIKAQPDNLASNRVAEKAGFHLAGQQPEPILDNLPVNVWERNRA